jgi:hypothetical protein
VQQAAPRSIARGAQGGHTQAEEDLARILLVEACEESDREGRFLPRQEREAASRAARHALRTPSAGSAEEAEPDPAAFVSERARRIVGPLTRRYPSLRALLGPARARVSAWLVLAATLGVGLALDELGAGRRVNLLAFPLLTLLVWNAAVYALLLLEPFLARHEEAGGLAGGAARAAAWLARRRIASAVPDEARWLAASAQRFVALWRRQAGALVAARLRRALHVGALGFAAGLVAGMYVRGLAFEYRATWESTFLDAPQVSTLLGTVLGPAAFVLDTLRPDARPPSEALLDPATLAALRSPSGDGPAAPWIHLWALTAAGWIGVPRALLAWREGRRARRLAGRLAAPLEEPYFLRLRAPSRGLGLRVAVVPYSHRPSPRTKDALLEVLHELLGNRARVRVLEAVPYGAEAPLLARSEDAPPHVVVVVFNLAQSPEQEVHGAFLDAVRAQHASLAQPRALLVLLDEEPYRERIGDDGGRDRLGQRRRTWERIGRAADLRFAVLRPLEADADAVLAEVRAALGSAAPEEAA